MASEVAFLFYFTFPIKLICEFSNVSPSFLFVEHTSQGWMFCDLAARPLPLRMQSGVTIIHMRMLMWETDLVEARTDRA